MSNFYTQFSTIISYQTEKEHQWLTQKLEEATKDESTEDDPAGFSFEDDPNEGHFWIYSEEWVNEVLLCNLVTKYQQKFSKTDPWQCTFAETCSKPALDAFNGFGIVVYRGEIYYFMPTIQMEVKIQELSALFDFEQTTPVI